jgi:Kef-type K+ transport system membrane component KefB
MVDFFAVFDLIAAQIPENMFLIFEIGMMIIIAGIIGFILKLLKQPLIPAYIIAGIILGPLGVSLIRNNETILVLSEIGVAFLLFFAGIEINLKRLKEVGKAAIVGGILQVTLLFTAGFYASLWLGLTGRIPLYVGLVVAFSSTMVVVKLLADKRELSSLHGRIVIGILLIQDIAAISALTVLTTDLAWASMSVQLLKALGFIIIAFILSKAINPVFKIAARHTELLLLIAISLLFLFAIGSYVAGLSLIIGAFFAGVVLANSDYRTEVQGQILPLRDFFAAIFFVALGMQLTLISKQYLFLLLILFGLVMIVKPLILMLLTRSFGYSKRTSFFTGNSLAQTSEFSLIIATIGLTSGFINQGLFSAFVLLTVVTMAASTYLIGYDKFLFNHFSWPLISLNKIPAQKETLDYAEPGNKKIVLFGCHRIGSLFLKFFSKRLKEVAVVDYDPEIISSLTDRKVSCLYGDFANHEVLEKVDLKHAQIVISTIPDQEGNSFLIKTAKKINSKLIIITTANSIDDAQQLYKSGADYVLLPKVISGEMCFNIAKKALRNKAEIKKMKKEHKQYLREIHNLLYD